MEHSSLIADGKFYFENVQRAAKSKVSLHSHDLMEIYYLNEGRCNYSVGNKLYKLCAGDIVIVPSGVIHNTNYISATHSRKLINCQEQLLPEKLRLFVLAEGNVFSCADARGETDDIFKRIEEEYTVNDGLSDNTLTAMLICLISCLLRHSKRSLTSDRVIRSCSERAMEYVRDNYMHRVTLSDAARYCSVSAEHLSREFARQTGVGFNEYLRLFRLSTAEAMLVNQPGISVSDIAFRCGFNDSNYFSSVFKKQYGISPSDKKRQGQK